MSPAEPHRAPLDPVRKVVALALQLAAEAPLRQNDRAYEARVRWQTMHQLRDALEAAGIDWRSFKQEVADRPPEPE